jgi:hypothetical protein
MEEDQAHRLHTLTHIFHGTAVSDHILAAIRWYSDEQAKDPDFVASVEEQRRALDAQAQNSPHLRLVK